MSIETLVAGAVATIFTITMQLPQIYHTIKIKKAEDISMSHLRNWIQKNFVFKIYCTLAVNFDSIFF